MTNKKVALLGCGNFGGAHAKELTGMGCLKYIVDTDPSKIKIADELGRVEVSDELHVGFIGGHDITRSIEILRDSCGEPYAHIITDYANRKCPGDWRFYDEITHELVNETDTWDIATNTPSHFPLMLIGLWNGKDVFVEKPPAERVSELAYVTKRVPGLSKTKVGVDYTEMAHPVVQATKDDLDFEPRYSFNRRSKDLRNAVERGMGGGEGSRIILENLVHDLSEIDVFRKRAYGKSLAEVSPEVAGARIQCWHELPERRNGKPKYPYSTDVRAKFVLRFPDGMISEIEGGFADPERRQFVLTDEEGKVAIYGNTLTRPNISPIAARVEGKKNVEYVLEKVKNGVIRNNTTQDKMLKRTNAETLEESMNKYVPERKRVDGEPMYGEAPLYNMLENFLKAESNSELICPLERALEYQRVAEHVYRKAGKPGAMIFRIVR